MYQLPKSQIRKTARQNNNAKAPQYPTAFSMTCPHCSDLVTFTASASTNTSAKAFAGAAACPACSKAVSVFTMQSPPDSSVVFVYPPPAARTTLSDDTITDIAAVDRAYHSAVKAYNVGLWDACLTSCRKTLEGIVKTQGNSTGKTLFQQLRDFFSSQDLSEPLVHLTDTIREGGNLGAHFDMDREPDQDLARMMLDLIDFFLEYIYLLPKQSQALEARLKSLESDEDTAG